MRAHRRNTKDDSVIFGKNVRRVILMRLDENGERLMTLTDLSITAGVEQSMLSRYLRGYYKIPLDVALRLANAVGYKIDDLLDPEFRGY